MIPDNAPHVVITPDGQILRYPRLSMAKAMWIDQTVIFTEASQLMERCSLHALNFYHQKMTGENPGWTNKRVAATALWPVLLLKASPHNPFLKGNRADGKRGARRQNQLLYFAAKEFWDQRSPRMPNQMYVLGVFLHAHEPAPGGYTWDQLEQTVRQAHDENVLETRQDPVRIFNYYCDRMVRMELLSIADAETGAEVDRPRNEVEKSIIVKTPLRRLR